MSTGFQNILMWDNESGLDRLIGEGRRVQGYGAPSWEGGKMLKDFPPLGSRRGYPRDGGGGGAMVIV